MSAKRDPLFDDNPFYVLELTPAATPVEITRQGQRLLGMLELGLEGADRYRTPLGSRPRTAEAVRLAIATLRDPVRRLRHALLTVSLDELPPPSAPPATPAWPDAFAVVPGYRRRGRRGDPGD